MSRSFMYLEVLHNVRIRFLIINKGKSNHGFSFDRSFLNGEKDN